MMKKTFLLLLTIPLLAACSTSTGIANQRYNGRVIEMNEEAITAYDKRQEIIGSEKEAVAIDIPDFFLESSLEWAGQEEPFPLTEDVLVVGQDISAGRYTIIKSEKMPSGYLTVADSNSNVIFEHFLDYNFDTLELNLHEGLQLWANEGREPRLELYGTRIEPGSNMVHIGGPEAPPLEENETLLYNGVHHVGVEIDAGLYDVKVLPSYSGSGSNYLYLLDPNGHFQLFELKVSPWQFAETGIEIEFEEDQIIFVVNIEGLHLTPIE